MTILHQIGLALRNVFGLAPLPWVRALFVGTLVGVLIWVMRLPAERTQPPGGARRWDENLKIGAAVALLIQIAIYLCL